jgi:hypothetical protein
MNILLMRADQHAAALISCGVDAGRGGPAVFAQVATWRWAAAVPVAALRRQDRHGAALRLDIKPAT